MIQIVSPCPKCFRTIPADRTYCPWCGCPHGAKPGAVRRPPAHLPAKVLIPVFFLLAVLVYVYYFHHVYPMMPVPVKMGDYKHCPVTGEDYDIHIKITQAPRMYQNRYKVKEIFACPPESLMSRDMPKLADLDQKCVDTSLLKKDVLANAVRKVYPKMNRAAAWFAGRGRLAVGMTMDQVFTVWGRTVRTEEFMRNGALIERLYFGDPVYGLFVSGRFADFKNGRVVSFSDSCQKMQAPNKKSL